MFETIKTIKDILTAVNNAKKYLKNNRNKIDSSIKILVTLKAIIPPIAEPIDKITKFLEKLKKWSGGTD